MDKIPASLLTGRRVAADNQATMKTSSKTTGTGNKNAQSALADINAKIAELQQERVSLAQPLKDRYTEAARELTDLATQIRDLDPSWKPASLKPKADAKITEILTSSERPMTVDEIMKELGGAFSPWKIKNTLKKKSTGAKAAFAVNDGRYSVKQAAA